VSRIPEAEADIVLERCRGYCEACGGPLPARGFAFHHRRALSMGGSKLPWIHTAANLMVVHGDFRLNCHNLTEYSIHQNPDRSKRLGHIVRDGVDPATVLVQICRDIRTVRA
jgi:hypothetical protein